MQFVDPMPFEEALEKLGDQSVVGSTLTSLDWQDVPVGLRDNAFFSATIEDVRFLQAAKDFVDDFLANRVETLDNGSKVLAAGSRAQFVKEMSDFAVSHGLGPLDPDLEGTMQDIRSQTRLSLIFNTKTQQMYSYGYWKQGMDPDLLDEFPAQRFIRIQDVKVKRVPHQLNEGVVKLKTDLPFWLSMNDPSFGGFGVPWGPWGFNSGMGEEDVDREEAEAAHLLKPGDKPQPIVKDVNDQLQASMEGLDDDMISHLKRSFGDQVQFTDDGTVKWSSQPSQPAPAPATPAPPPAAGDDKESLQDVLVVIGIAPGGKVTAADMSNLVSQLKETNPCKVVDVLDSIKGAKSSGSLTEEKILSHAQDFLDMIPPSVAKQLPDLKFVVTRLWSANGDYSKGTVRLNSDTLGGKPDAEVRRVVFHELEHWLHIDGPSQAFRDAIRDHFLDRTAGEQIVNLGYGDATGMLDKWYDAYAGRIYPWEGGKTQGLEVPTRYVEWLTRAPYKLAEQWNDDPDFAETFLISLGGFFR